MKYLKKIFSRFVIFGLLLILQFALIIFISFKFTEYFNVLYILSVIAGISERVKEQTKKFLELMADERVQEDELAYEFNCALSPVLHYDLFKTDS